MKTVTWILIVAGLAAACASVQCHLMADYHEQYGLHVFEVREPEATDGLTVTVTNAGQVSHMSIDGTFEPAVGASYGDGMLTVAVRCTEPGRCAGSPEPSNRLEAYNDWRIHASAVLLVALIILGACSLATTVAIAGSKSETHIHWLKRDVRWWSGARI